MGERVFFEADDGVHGRELFVLDLAQAKGPHVFSDGFESGDVSAWTVHP